MDLEEVEVSVNKPASCEVCGAPMALLLSLHADTYSVPGKTLVHPWPEWACDACEIGYSFEYEDLEPEDLELLESEENKLLYAHFQGISIEDVPADWKRLDAIARRKADRAARLARRKR